jgi:hypothetical protein
MNLAVLDGERAGPGLAEAGIGEGGEWIAGAAGTGSPPPMECGVARRVMEPVAKECYTYTRS